MVRSSPSPAPRALSEDRWSLGSSSPAELLRVLLVEDDELDAELANDRLRTSVRPRFLLVHEARLCDALARLSRAAEAPEDGIDVILLDLNLPDSLGFLTAQRMIEAHPEIPVVVLTGIRDESTGTRALQFGAQDFLCKEDLDTEILRRSLRYAVERHAMKSSADAAACEARAAAARLRRLIVTSAEGFVVLDGSHVVRFVNPAAEAILGRAESRLLGKPLPLPFGLGLCDANELNVARADGTLVPVEVRVAPLEWEGGDATLVSLHDLSDRRREARVALAQEVQRAFLPERAALETGTLAMAARNELCEDASGDFYDFVALRDGRIAVAVGDVTGHGLGPALLMAQGRAFLRAFCDAPSADRARELPALMERLNDALAAEMSDGRFMSLFLAILDPRTGSLSWCNAGHVPALLRRARTGVIESLEATGMPLGILAGLSFDADVGLRLEPGDVLLLTTDGLTEASRADGEQFGLERAVDVLRGDEAEGGPWATPDEPLDALRVALDRFTEGRSIHDDLTLLAIRRDGCPAPSSIDVESHSSADVSAAAGR